VEDGAAADGIAVLIARERLFAYDRDAMARGEDQPRREERPAARRSTCGLDANTLASLVDTTCPPTTRG
jgi:hypothetical protein